MEYTPEVGAGAPAMWPDVRRALESGQGVYTTTMGVLRNLEGAGRTGKEVTRRIRERLDMYGIGHVPEKLPNYQHEPVVLFLKVSEAGEAVLRIREDRPSRELATILRKLNEPTEEMIPKSEVIAPLTEAYERVTALAEQLGATNNKRQR